MALLVLALGAFMSICGIASIGYGSGIVADKDWVSVLIGVTALSGGFVTLALGAVVKTLVELRDAVRAGTLGALSIGGQTSALSSVEMGAPAALPEIASSQPSLDAGRASLMTPELESGMLAAILSSQENHEHAVGDHGHSLAHETMPAGHDDVATQAFEPSDDPARYTVAFKGRPANEPTAVELDGPAMDDWLDRAFSALDEEVSPAPPHRPPGDSGHPSEHELAHADLEPALDTLAEAPSEASYLTPHNSEPPQSEPLRGAEAVLVESAVIGRYEADGTTYVMYADGSIEAQSEAGIYRFASMAELKAHIEGGH